jgi:hypothetical protein
MNQEIKLIISTDNTGAITGVRQMGTEIKSMETGATSSMNSISASLASLTGKVAIVYEAWKAFKATMELGKESALLSARVTTLGTVMDVVGKNAGYSSVQMQTYASAVRDMGITTQESRQTVISMAQAQIDLKQASELARVAQDAAVIGNINSSEALGRMVYGIKSNNVEVLRTIGINVNFEDSYKRIAQELKKNKDSLTEAERAQARTNAVLQAGTLIAGAYEAAMGTVGKQLSSLPRYTEEIKLKLGQMIEPSLAVVVTELTASLKELDGELKGLQESGDAKRMSQEWAEWTRNAIADVTRLAMFLDLVGGSVTRLGYALNFGMGDWERWNKMFEERYKSGERRLSDMAMRAEGLRRATPEELGMLDYGTPALNQGLAKVVTDYGQILYYTKEIKKASESTGKGPSTAPVVDQKKIDDLNQRLRETIAGATGDERAMIDLQVKEWTKGGADKALIAQAKEALITKILAEEGNKRREIVTKEIEERVKAEEQAKRTLIDIQQQQIQQESSLAQKAAEIAVQQGGIKQEDAIRIKYDWQKKTLEQQDKGLMLDQELAKTGAELNALSEKRWLLHKQIGDLKVYESYELDALRIQKEKELVDLVQKERDSRKQAYEGMFQNTMGQVNLIGGEAAQGMGKVGAGTKTMADIVTGQDPYTQKEQATAEHYNRLRELSQTVEMDQYELHRARLEAEESAEAASWQRKTALTASGFGTLAGIAQTFYALSGNQSKAAFKAFQALSIAETTVSTIKAAQDAYAWGMKYGGPAAPYVAAAAAAVAIAAGMARVYAIASMEPGGTASTAAAPSGGGGYSYEQPTAPSWEQTGTKAAPSITINVYGNIVDQTQFARDLAPLIQQAYEDGVRG